MDVPIDLLNKTFLAVPTPEMLNREMKPYVILHVAALVLLSIAYFTDKKLSFAAGAHLNDIQSFVQRIYVDFIFVL